MLLFESHCHTVFSSDGHITPPALQRACRRRGIDLVAITDHDTIAGALEFRRYFQARSAAPRILVGEERTLADGSHLIGLLLREALSALTLPEALEEIRAQGGLSVIPHPLRARDGAWVRAADAVADAVEIFNPKCDRAENHAAAERRPAGVRPWSGSDAHYADDLGEGLVELPGRTEDPEALLRAVFLGQAEYRLLGIPQAAGSDGRQYLDRSPWVRHHPPLPRRLRPWAWRAYALYRNYRLRPRPLLEAKYGG